MNEEIVKLNAEIEKESEFIDRLREAIHRRIVGQEALIDRLLVGLLSDGHILLEGVPGLAKTLAVRTLSDVIKTNFQRIQFTPDLLPADIIGTLVYNHQTGEFITKKGPIFSNIILADEINRAPAKVQSALLEAMQERQVTIGDETFKLDSPFLVMATENPIEQQGTYPLPEAQVDRFMLKVLIDYPKKDEEKQIMRVYSEKNFIPIEPVVEPKEILTAREVVKRIYVDEKIDDYILDIVFATRQPEKYGMEELSDLIAWGASPRASIYLKKVARAHAFINHRGYVTPEDVRAMLFDVLRHRVIVTYEAEAEEMTSEDIIRKIVNRIEVP
ncbi:MAG: ATPase [candidate division Zixibacteria bacterium 4484_93]|nr:MAG: ATPase [candidate division Zixibacteria bacterium 4484_93]